MGITIDGSSAAGNIDLGTNGTITDLAEGGLPNAKIINADIKDDTISEAKLDIHADPSGTDKYLAYTTNGMEWAAVSGGISNLYPHFQGILNPVQYLSPNTATKLTVDEEVDTGGQYASDRFTPTVAGRYIFWCFATCGGTDKLSCELYLRKNNSNTTQAQALKANDDNQITLSFIASATANGTGDYFEMWGWSWNYTDSDNIPWNNKKFGAIRIGDA
jgi:hypothetical protein